MSSDSDILAQFRSRQTTMKNVILNRSPEIRTAFVFAKAGRAFNFNQVLLPKLEGLATNQNPDFELSKVFMNFLVF